MKPILALGLLMAPAALLAGCSQSASPNEADLQQRLAAAEARADAAEKRLKALESSDSQHASAPVINNAPQPANDPDSFTRPMDDTAPVVGGQSGGDNSAPVMVNNKPLVN